jgi:hypothetical protein
LRAPRGEGFRLFIVPRYGRGATKGSPMRLFTRLAVIAAFSAAAAPAAAQNWVEHKPDGVGYRVEMPAAPRVSQRDVPTQIGPIKTTMALVDRGTIAFIVSHNDYPAEAVKTVPKETMLDNISKGQVGAHKLRSQESITIGGQPARHLVIDTAQGQVLVSRLVMVEARLFQVIYVGPKGSEESDDAKRFVASFQLVN